MPKLQKNKFFKGPKLLSLARKKAIQLGLAGDGVGLEELIRQVQEKAIPLHGLHITCRAFIMLLMSGSSIA